MEPVPIKSPIKTFTLFKMIKTLGDTAARINQGERLLSENGHFEFIGKPNGDFCIHQLIGKKKEIWHPSGGRWRRASKHGVKSTFFQAQRTDGNVVAYVVTNKNHHRHWWASGNHHHGSGKNMLKLWNDGNLCAYKNINNLDSIYWSTKTQIDISFYVEKAKLEQELADLNVVVKNLNEKLRKTTVQITALNGEIKRLTNENEQLRRVVSDLNQKIKTVVDNTDKLADNVDIIKQYAESNDRLNERVRVLESKVSRLTELLVQKTADEKENELLKIKFDRLTQILARLVQAHE